MTCGIPSRFEITRIPEPSEGELPKDFSICEIEASLSGKREVNSFKAFLMDINSALLLSSRCRLI